MAISWNDQFIERDMHLTHADGDDDFLDKVQCIGNQRMNDLCNSAANE